MLILHVDRLVLFCAAVHLRNQAFYNLQLAPSKGDPSIHPNPRLSIDHQISRSSGSEGSASTLLLALISPASIMQEQSSHSPVESSIIVKQLCLSINQPLFRNISVD
jgi:hypothetical protein